MFQKMSASAVFPWFVELNKQKHPNLQGTQKSSRCSCCSSLRSSVAFSSGVGRMPFLLKSQTGSHRGADTPCPPHCPCIFPPALSPGPPRAVSFLLELKYKNKKHRAFMQISRCLGTHKLQGFISETRANLNSLRAEKICYLTELSARLKMGLVPGL